ncbi:MAG TPA: enoyl-CoA hydratase/isomerase family protein, partial [Ilumatobacteraceae bacterium]|nr:enoyl-CoA hydratase/isomerase family protein [Ilumatobacteraceae bacterium]
MTQLQHFQVCDDDGVRTITIDRPEVKNALTKTMRDGLCDLLAATDADSSIGVVIITAVDPVFSAGVDFKDIAAAGAESSVMNPA